MPEHDKVKNMANRFLVALVGAMLLACTAIEARTARRSHSKRVVGRFDDFLAKYEKDYANDAAQYEQRLQVFARNLKVSPQAARALSCHHPRTPPFPDPVALLLDPDVL